MSNQHADARARWATDAPGGWRPGALSVQRGLVRAIGQAAVVAVASALLAGCTAGRAAPVAASPAGTITASQSAVASPAAAFQEHVAYLASDELEGRGTGTRGNDAAAGYIAEHFRRAGLRPAGENGTFFQPFEVTLGQKIEGHVSLSVSGAPGLGVLHRDFVPLPFGENEAFEGPLAFAGYGIVNREAGYDDYGDFDVRGKVLLILRYEPHSDDPNAGFGGRSPSQFATFEHKARQARQRGAAALLIVNPPMHRGERDELFRFETADEARSYGIPMMHVSRVFAERILAGAGRPDLKTLQEQLDLDRKPQPFDVRGVSVRGNPGLVRQRAATRNVVGLLPGRGKLADEYVVIGAHFDHVGITVPRGSRSTTQATAPEPQIHNGADDNASGTAGLLLLAERFARWDGGDRRGLLFIAFSAEEIGLLGSRHFVEHPAVPLEKIVAMLNMDMIGRLRNEQLQVFGTKTSPLFEDLVAAESRERGLSLKTSAGGFGPSDHTSFYARHIPVLHFFTGIHDDYHRPSDDADKINAEGGARIVDLIGDVTAELITRSERPTYVAVAESQPSRTGARVRMGVMPAYADDEQPGMGIDGVSPGSPAKRAGLQAGDRILMIGPHAVNNVYDLMEAMGHYEPGNEVSLTILRKGERLQLPLTFAAP